MENQDKHRIKVTRREFLVGGGAVLALAAFAACSNKTIPATSESTSIMPSTTTSSALTPKYGGILKLLDATSVTGNIGWPPEMMIGGKVSQFAMETLLRQGNHGNAYPWLAESYKVADDMKSVTFILRKGVKFIDGSDFNSEVAKWNLDNMINAKMEPYWSSVDIIDEYTIRVNLAQWNCTLLSSFGDAQTMAYIVSKVAYEKNGKEWMKQNIVGTGPFEHASSQQDVYFKLKKNPDYWLKGKPYLDGIDFTFISDMTTLKMEVQSGVGDMVEVVTATQAADFKAMGLNVDFTIDTVVVLIPDTSNTSSPWASKNVREAAEYAIDRESISKAFGYGYLQAPYQIPARSSLAYNPDFTLGRKYDVDKAKQLLTEAGYSNGFKTTIISTSFLSKDPLLAVQQYWSKVGIQVELEFLEVSKYFMYMRPDATWAENSLLVSPVSRFDSNFIGGLQLLFNNIGNSWLRPPEIMQAYQAVLTSFSPDVQLVRTVTDMITRDALLIPVYETGTGKATRSYVVAGFNERSFIPFWNSEDAWLNK